jgi:heptosyltransferase III
LIPYYGLVPAFYDYSSLLSQSHFNLIIHPKSKGSAREWSLDSYYELVNTLPGDSYKIFITGLKEEGDLIRKEKPELLQHNNVTDLTGQLNLEELASFICQADALLACSTGVLHLAAALGIYALGIYAPLKPIHPGRWKPVGKNADYLVLKKDCNACRLSKDCSCIRSISVQSVADHIKAYHHQMERFTPAQLSERFAS